MMHDPFSMAAPFIIIWLIGVAFFLAFWGSLIVALWMLILGKLPFQGPKLCPKCGADLRNKP
ncbi:MAG TPA: hypothetical protein VGZ26_07595 [Pirellulales bacterium]|jgi:hypothetical protein|nr:hypothetical protein [Pirellulales bacterium]